MKRIQVTLHLALIMEVGYIVSIWLPNGNFMKKPMKQNRGFDITTQKASSQTILSVYKLESKVVINPSGRFSQNLATRS